MKNYFVIPIDELPQSTNPREFTSFKKEDMFALIYTGDLQGVKKMIQKGVSVNLRNDQDQPLLLYAVLYNQVKIAKLLISMGASLNLTVGDNNQTIGNIIKAHDINIYNQLNEYENNTKIIPSTTPLPLELDQPHNTSVQELGGDRYWCCDACVVN